MNFNEIKRNFMSFFYFLLFSIPFFIGAVWQLRDGSPIVSSLPIIKSILRVDTSNIFLDILVSCFKLFLLSLPILLITFLELKRSDKNFQDSLLSTSVGKIYLSKGHKFADVWYFATELIFSKFPQILTFITLGMVVFNSKISNWFSNFYTNTLNIPTSPSLSIFIVLIFILLTTLFSYLKHRCSHEIPFLWDLHELHHSPTEMTILSKDRKTPLDGIFFTVILIPFYTFLTLLLNEYFRQGYLLPTLIYISFICLDNIHSAVGHSSFKLIYPKPFNYILMSPSLHWIHHSSNPKHFNSNFGDSICIWDRLFNTYSDETILEDIKSYGFKYSEYNKHHPIYSLVILPIVKMKKRLKRINKRLKKRVQFE